MSSLDHILVTLANLIQIHGHASRIVINAIDFGTHQTKVTLFTPTIVSGAWHLKRGWSSGKHAEMMHGALAGSVDALHQLAALLGAAGAGLIQLL
jgi:hypothetical protein